MRLLTSHVNKPVVATVLVLALLLTSAAFWGTACTSDSSRIAELESDLKETARAVAALEDRVRALQSAALQQPSEEDILSTLVGKTYCVSSNMSGLREIRFGYCHDLQ